MSRPNVVKLLEAKSIPHVKVGTHRRIGFEGLESFKGRHEAKRRKALDVLAAEAQELEMGY